MTIAHEYMFLGDVMKANTHVHMCAHACFHKHRDKRFEVAFNKM